MGNIINFEDLPSEVRSSVNENTSFTYAIEDEDKYTLFTEEGEFLIFNK